ncbi:methylated-DNA--[protein]-cysteine S-methyltransferase [Arthrobacter sp. HY1533]|uniref:methylated-DNA--[protein]-cysteine S-methyltransferase n=1 Tax=Arthrobacter sp. HY1533 TaxID=2970919 RepID=UPI003FA4B484
MLEKELPAGLEGFAAAEGAALERLGAAFREAATADGLVDVAYRTVDSPVGELLLAGTPEGLLRVAFASEGLDAVLEQLATSVSPRVLRAPGRLDAAARELEEYFAGRRRVFDLPLDFRLAKGFRREVLAHLPEIGYGHTASYAAVAAMTSSPRAVRAVGTACARNPLPLVVPCHRVVRSDGSQGAYLGGTEAKALLLAMEAAAA